MVIAVGMPRAVQAQVTCGGTERWAVKVGSDPLASSIDLTTRVPTMVHDLVHLPRPTLPGDDVTRTSDEQTVRTIDARLVKFKHEGGKTGDSDFHLVMSDDTLQFSTTSTISEHSFIAEVVDPSCVAGRNGTVPFPSQFQDVLTDVYSRFIAQFPNMVTDGSWNETNGLPVRVTGIGFFDRPHEQTGRALNGLEIHPIVDIVFNPPGTTVTPTPTTLVQNGDFEAGATGWTTTPGVITNDQTQPPHGGQFKAWLGGYGVVHTDRLSQQVTLPATTTGVTFSLFLRISTEEQTTTQPYDKLVVQVVGSNNQTTTLATFSNLDAGPEYHQQVFNLTPFRGQTIRIVLVATEDNGSWTNFVVDDAAIVVE
jgi:hypothetical protein